MEKGLTSLSLPTTPHEPHTGFTPSHFDFLSQRETQNWRFNGVTDILRLLTLPDRLRTLASDRDHECDSYLPLALKSRVLPFTGGAGSDEQDDSGSQVDRAS